MEKKRVKIKRKEPVEETSRPTVRARQSAPSPHRANKTLRAFTLGQGVPSIPEMVNEIQDMIDVLLGRVEPPMQAGYLTMMEVADGYYARAAELTIKLQEAEREGRITKGSAHYRFRTGELRTFLEMCKRSADLGSRRLTKESLQFEMETKGRESA